MPEELSVVKGGGLESLLLPVSGHFEDLHDLQLIHGVCSSVCVLDILYQAHELLTVLGQHLGEGDHFKSRPHLPIMVLQGPEC